MGDTSVCMGCVIREVSSEYMCEVFMVVCTYALSIPVMMLSKQRGALV